MTVLAVESSLEGFHYDPKAGRPERLRKALRLVAEQIRLALAAALYGLGRSSYRALFVTLTYKANTKGDPKDVSETLNRIRDWLARQNLPMCPYLWVAELQKRGALHYHLMVWLPKHLHLPKLDRRGWWKHGMTKVETARNPVGYLVKYASKFNVEDLKRLRKGTRLYGYGGLFPEVRENVRRVRMARWMRQRVDVIQQAEFEGMIEQEIREQEREEAYFWEDVQAIHGVPYEPPAWLVEEREREAYEDPDVLREEYEERKEEEWRVQCILDGLRKRGGSRFARCVGGFVDRFTGELSATPWAAEFRNGILHVWPKEAV